MSGDLISAINKFRTAFLEAGIEPPAQIILARPEDGKALLDELWRATLHSTTDGRELLTKTAIAGNPAYRRITLFGIEIRWPASAARA